MKSVELILYEKLRGIYPAGTKIDSFKGIVDSTQTRVVASLEHMETRCKHIPEVRKWRNLHNEYIGNRDRACEIANEINRGDY